MFVPACRADDPAQDVEARLCVLEAQREIDHRQFLQMAEHVKNMEEKYANLRNVSRGMMDKRKELVILLSLVH